MKSSCWLQIAVWWFVFSAKDFFFFFEIKLQCFVNAFTNRLKVAVSIDGKVSQLYDKELKKIGWCIFLMMAHKTSVPSLLQTLWLCCQGAVKASRVLHSMVRHLNGPHIKFTTHSTHKKADEMAGSGVWCNVQIHHAEILQEVEVIGVNTDTNAELFFHRSSPISTPWHLKQFSEQKWRA